MTDEDIIELYNRRDENAIIESDNAYGSYCYSIADNILHEHRDSQECVNDTWFRAWNLIPPKKPLYLSVFFGSITRNLSFDVWRKNKAKKRSGNNPEISAILEELEETIPSGESVIDRVIANELAAVINSFIGKLKPRDRAIFLRRYYYADKTSDIAASYNIKESNVLMILSRLRKKLEAHLEKEGY